MWLPSEVQQKRNQIRFFDEFERKKKSIFIYSICLVFISAGNGETDNNSSVSNEDSISTENHHDDEPISCVDEESQDQSKSAGTVHNADRY